MLENKDIACGYSKKNRYQVAAIWKHVETVLNGAGPPTKSAFEWKKVWTDQKRYVLSKVSTNLQHMRGTGGGPNRTIPLSDQEQTIYELIGAKDCVEGIPETQVLWQKLSEVADVQIIDEVLPACSSWKKLSEVADVQIIDEVSGDVLSVNSPASSTVTLGSPRLKKMNGPTPSVSVLWLWWNTPVNIKR